MPPAVKKSSPTTVQSQALQLACAECKRLKLKCSKTVPCDACTRRGCESICPNGSLKSGRGTRFILSNTEELHQEIQSLRSRNKELETALVDLQAQVSTDPHPLLKDSPLLPSSTSPGKGKLLQDEEEVLIDTFGSLTIGPDGSSEWFGRHGGSEFFIGPEDRTTPPPQCPKGPTAPLLPVELVFLSKMFPFKVTYSIDDEVRRQVRARLPSREVAWELAHEYYAHIAWSTNPVHWTEFLDQAMNPVYGDREPRDEQVALVFVVLALGTALDLKKQPFDPQAMEYIYLARVSLMLGEDILQSRSFVVIQTLHLIAFYYHISHDPAGPSKSWMLTAMAVRMAEGAGLHRDSERWDKFPAEAERRRRLWWEISTFECVQCFMMGRPRMINPGQCDTKMPKDSEDVGGAPTFNRVKFKWVNQCLGPFIDAAYGPKPPPYSQILKLDRNMRDYPFPEVPAADDVPLSTGMRIIVVLMRSFTTGGMREIALLYLHRTYLVEALMRWPEDPLKSKFALSVLAAHRSSLLIIQGLSRLHSQLSDLIPRITFLYLHAFSAYVCLCAIVIRSPGCALARSCLAEIDRAKDLFSHVKTYRLTQAMGVIDKLHNQAQAAYEAFRNGSWPPKRSQASPDDKLMVDNVYVLRFAGASGMVAVVDSEQHLAQERTTKSPTVQPLDGVHPTLFEYLQAFQNAGTTCRPTGLQSGSGISSNFCNTDILETCPFPSSLQIAQPVPAIPDHALFRPPIPSAWSADGNNSTGYTQGTEYTPLKSAASCSSGSIMQAVDTVVSGTEPLFELGPPQNGSPLNDIDDIRKLYQMDMDALMRTMSFQSPVNMAPMGGGASLLNSHSKLSPAPTTNSSNESPLDWDKIFAMQAPSMDTTVPEQGWERFLMNGWS